MVLLRSIGVLGAIGKIEQQAQDKMEKLLASGPQQMEVMREESCLP